MKSDVKKDVPPPVGSLWSVNERCRDVALWADDTFSEWPDLLGESSLVLVLRVDGSNEAVHVLSDGVNEGDMHASWFNDYWMTRVR